MVSQNFSKIIATKKTQLVTDVLPFSHIWSHVADHVGKGGAANEIDVLVTSRACPQVLVDAVETHGTPRPIDIEVGLRGGVYLLPE